MAIFEHSDLTLWLAGPQASASKPMPDGSVPQPGGWSRFVLTVDNLDVLHDQLNAAGVTLRSAIVEGPGGRQLLCADPAGNVVELFEARS